MTGTSWAASDCHPPEIRISYPPVSVIIPVVPVTSVAGLVEKFVGALGPLKTFKVNLLLKSRKIQYRIIRGNIAGAEVGAAVTAATMPTLFCWEGTK